MIRIYFDWNIFSILKDPKAPEFIELKELISTNKDDLQIIYSDAHFDDLMKSYSPENKLFFEDIKNLDELTQGHYLTFEGKSVKPYIGLPSAYFDNLQSNTNRLDYFNLSKIMSTIENSSAELGQPNITNLLKVFLQNTPSPIDNTLFDKSEKIKQLFPDLKENSSMWDLVHQMLEAVSKLFSDKEFYKSFRTLLQTTGGDLGKNSGEWKAEEIFANLDKAIATKAPGVNKTFLEIISEAQQNQQNSTEYSAFLSTYLSLDILGIKSDKLPKPNNNAFNILNDAKHAYYAGHCDFFVAMDKNLLFKAKGIYQKFNINTEVLDVKGFVERLKLVIHKPDSCETFFKDCIDILTENNLHIDPNEPIVEGATTNLFKLPFYLLNYFNYGIHTVYDDGGRVIIFRRVYKNLSRFVYYTEDIRLIKLIFDLFDYKSGELDKEIHDFAYNLTDRKQYLWKITDDLYFSMNREEDIYRISISILIAKPLPDKDVDDV